MKKTKIKNEDITMQMLFAVARAAYDKKGEDILLLDISKLTVIADYFIIVTGKSKPQIQAISDHIDDELKKIDYPASSKEGYEENSWVVLDFGDIIVHVMSPEMRDYYKLERFWSNGTIIKNEKWKK